MASEPDLSALLPPAPPPRPNAREVAIDAALRRYDGEAAGPTPAPVPPRRRGLIGKPQFGVLAAAALVAAIGLPLWLADGNRTPMPTRTPAAITAPAGPPMADLAGVPPAETVAPSAPGIVMPPPRDEMPPAAAAAPRRDAPATGAPAKPPAPETFAPAPPPPPPPPPTAAPAAAEDASDTADIVVTGSRMNRAAKARQRIERRVAGPGDWNACTVDDPRQDLGACRNAGALGEGLTKAWQDDADGALAAFDRALAAAPKSGAAWLNRGLAHAREGDDERALADLDQAVRYAPNSARAWFQRSLILRRLGKTDRADADAARAAALDPRYEDLLE